MMRPRTPGLARTLQAANIAPASNMAMSMPWFSTAVPHSTSMREKNGRLVPMSSKIRRNLGTT